MAPDPRPHFRVVDGRGVVVGRVCLCGHTTAELASYCPSCGGDLEAAQFSARGTVWSWTMVHVPGGRDQVPYLLAYVDLQDGPRVLAEMDQASPVSVGAAAEVVAVDEGNLVAVVR